MARLILIATLVTEPAVCTTTSAEELAKYSAEQLIARLDGPQESIPNISGTETFVELYLGSYRLHYSAENEDEPTLLAAMLDDSRPLERRLCLASFLLDLNNRQARELITQCLDGKHGPVARENATLALISEEDRSWRHQQILRLLEADSKAERYDTAWSALCQRAGELKLRAAVDPLISVLARRPTDGAAALALANIGDRRAIPVLLRCVESDNPQNPFRETGVHEFHLYALQMLDAPGLPAVLLRHLDDYECVEMLADLNVREAIEPLERELATSPDEELNAHFRVALARLTANSQSELATRLLQIASTADSDGERILAVTHIGETAQRAAIPTLLKFAQTSIDSSMVHHAIMEIGEIGGDQAATALIPLFDHDFSHVPQFSKRPRGEEVRDFDSVVAIALGLATGANFGNDPAAWREFLHK